jgi:hypothetical protein
MHRWTFVLGTSLAASILAGCNAMPPSPLCSGAGGSCACEDGTSGACIATSDGASVCECAHTNGVMGSARDASLAPPTSDAGAHDVPRDAATLADPQDAALDPSDAHVPHDEDAGNSWVDAAINSMPDAATPERDAASSTSCYTGPCHKDDDCPGARCLRNDSVSVCATTCLYDSDCPAAPSGSGAQPTCVGANPALATPGDCVLSCALLTTECPLGMTCASVLGFDGRCAWK